MRGQLVSVDVWPFHERIFDESPPGAAWPHNKGKPFGPMLVYFCWEDEKDDDFWLNKMREMINNIRSTALDLKLTTLDAPYYNNLSLEDEPASSIYRNELGRLQAVKRRYDPRNTMGYCGERVHKIEP